MVSLDITKEILVPNQSTQDLLFRYESFLFFQFILNVYIKWFVSIVYLLMTFVMYPGYGLRVISDVMFDHRVLQSLGEWFKTHHASVR